MKKKDDLRNKDGTFKKGHKGHPDNPGAPKGHPNWAKDNPRWGRRPRKWDGEELERLAESLEKWLDNAMHTKTAFLFKEWCFENGVRPSHFAEYTPRNDRLNEVYKMAKEWQEHMVSKGALFNKLNPKFAQFFLGANHQWSTKEVVEHQGNEVINVVHFGEKKEPKPWKKDEK